MAFPWQKLHVTVLGCGFMGTAILQGLFRDAKDGPEIRATACVRSSTSIERAQKALAQHKDRITFQRNNFAEAAKDANVVMLGVPPDQLEALLSEAGLVDALRNKAIISLLAGVSTAQILQALAKEQDQRKQFHLVRVIPTIGAQYGDSLTLLADTDSAGKEEQAACEWLLNQIGAIQPISEDLIDTATAVGAACNALSFLAIDAVVDGSVADGLPRDTALSLAAQSLRSAAGLACNGMSPESIRAAMSIPRGITINSLLQLERGQVRSGISDSVRHAIAYTKGMSS
ncbi:pyrroline-5-carboxylate reductase-like protein [Elsinoe australis]|uniref:Pyrroline-5-carboxylate reductase-like protein n=1 Tax=Elsinoe australis TaxID=40998 RepID=A0A4U7B4Y8_9PEZI|nr:pyrroline-5-carboxylate reductase-like protein [Elsinoe australis]